MLTSDSIFQVNEKSIYYFQDFTSIIKENKGETVLIYALRDADTVQFNIDVPETGLIGVYTDPASYFTFKEKNYTFLEAIPAGFSRTWQGIGNYLKQLKLLFSKEVKAYESVGGFITIGNIFPATWDWQSFWRLTAFLSIMLAILNLLPIPALDGGHVMFLMYEIITGRKPSEKFMEYAQIVGMVLLFALLIYANGNDIIKLFR